MYSEEFDSTDFVRISSKSEFIDIESHPRDNSIECCEIKFHSCI